jgi:hypothetical protein
VPWYTEARVVGHPRENNALRESERNEKKHLIAIEKHDAVNVAHE